jgi:cation diffusion facilitator CzcD-associated flavoprotein CzcO
MTSVAIIGAGMSGLCMGAKLRQAGLAEFVILEKATELGGTWRENTYPGLTCDVPSRFYSFSFAPNPDWSGNYASGSEIWSYLSNVADRFGLRPHIRLGQEVVTACWQDRRWKVRTADDTEFEADVLISACGVLHHPRMPDIPRLEDFAGPMFHSARWDHSVALDGRRIGVIGTGSTGVQITSALAVRASRLVVFQRTAQWVLPIPDIRYSRLSRWAFRRVPILNRLGYRGYQTMFERLFGTAVVSPGWQRRLLSGVCRAHLRTVRDPQLRQRLTPDYEPMCKRLVMSSSFYRAMQRASTELVTAPISRVEPQGVRTADGSLYELDVLVLATGFDAHAYLRPIELVGNDGVKLSEVWAGEPHGYRTVALPGFPNFFMLMGPHSPFGNQSLILVAETQADYVVQWLRLMGERDLAAVVPRKEATERFNEEMRRALPSTVWITGCRSWYLGADGLPALWPWTPNRHREMLAQPQLDEFELDGRGQLAAVPSVTAPAAKQ